MHTLFITFGSCVLTNSYNQIDHHKEEEHLQVLKQQVKKMLVAGDTPQHELICLIDDIQRLGLSYHFEAEFDTILQHINNNFQELYCSKNDVGLLEVGLCFRLLRQQGHDVSSGRLTLLSSFKI